MIAVAAAFAQAETLRAYIPFEFRTSKGSNFQPGTYDVQKTTTSGGTTILSIRSQATLHGSLLTMPIKVLRAPGAKATPSLIFNCTDGCHLMEVWTGETGYGAYSVSTPMKMASIPLVRVGM